MGEKIRWVDWHGITRFLLEIEDALGSTLLIQKALLSFSNQTPSKELLILRKAILAKFQKQSHTYKIPIAENVIFKRSYS